MAVNFHPDPGTVVICDFSGFREPEMIKRRPVIVLSPRFRTRDKLCTVVPLSTQRPKSICEYHCQLAFDPVLPEPYNEPRMWVKADMVSAVSFERLFLPSPGKDSVGQRIYDVRHIGEAEFKLVQKCVLHGIGLASLTSHL
ncbi:type II toxin-antitoxin system PemK/MazF family toxin [Pseudoxanthomonas winnipegensis]|uniref:Type II toxin-antitoxin system PemK/MazF family toxin n=1 Tax=Pseudoxanthomonas winnipegensis TaxID=2480810 RepID=A0A4Q8L5C4_9GAMM|nr:type II toxin-antitoxin system PemK/MazF family toxin [Pseudoxanthomonas winnipegensis]